MYLNTITYVFNVTATASAKFKNPQSKGWGFFYLPILSYITNTNHRFGLMLLQRAKQKNIST